MGKWKTMPAVGGVRRKGAKVSMMEIHHPESDRMYASSSETPTWVTIVAAAIIIAVIIFLGWLIAVSIE